jgi:hypothetical protein
LQSLRVTRLIRPILVLFLLVASSAQAAGSRAGATRAAKRHTIAHVERFGITFRTADLDVQCSVTGRSR